MFRIERNEALVEGVKKDDFSITPMPGSQGDNSGSFLPLPIVGRVMVAGKGCIKSPLAFAMAGCKNTQGAVGAGQGLISAKQGRANDGTRYLVLGDEGTCNGALVGTPLQAPGPCSCKFRLRKSGQVGGAPPPVAKVDVKSEMADGCLEVEYLDAGGKPIPEAACTVKSADGEVLFNGVLGSGGRTVISGKSVECRVVSISIYADPQPLRILPDYESIPNPLRTITPQPADPRQPEPGTADGALEWLSPPNSLSLREWIYGVAIGDFNEDATPDPTVARTIITLIPVVDQVGDLQDLAASFYHIVWKEKYNDPLRWLTLTLTLIGCFPEAGSAAKGVLKILWKAVGERFPQLVRFLNRIARGNAVRWLWKLKDKLLEWSGKLAKIFVAILIEIRKKFVKWAGWTPGVGRIIEMLDTVRGMADRKIADALNELAAKLEECLLKGGKRFETKVVTGRKYTIRQVKQSRKVLKKAEREKVPSKPASDAVRSTRSAVYNEIKKYRPAFGSDLKTEMKVSHPHLHNPEKRDALVTTHGPLARRHKVSYSTLRERFLTRINGLSNREIAEVLGSDFAPQSLSDKTSQLQQKKYLKWLNDDYANLWIGSHAENLRIGTGYDQSPHGE